MSLPRPRPGILEIAPYVGGKSKVASDRPIAKLSSNESPLGPSPRAVAAYRELAGELHRYPDGGAAALRQAIGRRHNLDPELIVCGAGSDELIALLIKAYAGPGDEVLYSAHGFLMYRLSALAAGAHPVTAPERGLKADVDALLAAVTSRTRLVFIANPNNPTGSYLTGEELRRLHAGLPEDVILVVDAAYAEYASAADYASGLELAREAANVVMTRTFSKLHGLAALRVGWMTGSRGDRGRDQPQPGAVQRRQRRPRRQRWRHSRMSSIRSAHGGTTRSGCPGSAGRSRPWALPSGPASATSC